MIHAVHARNACPPLPAPAACRDLAGAPDPLACYAALSDGGRRPDTMLIERAGGPALLLDRAALRIECRGRRVRLVALSDNGRHALDALARTPAARGASPRGDALLVHVPAATGHDAAARLAAPSPFDVLRALLGPAEAAAETPFARACLGVLAYDHVDLFETLPEAASDPLGHPDFLFWLPESLLVFAHGRPPRAVCADYGAGDAEARLDALAERAAAAAPLAAAPAAAPDFGAADLDDRAFARVVGRMKAHIAAGEVYQIVPSRAFAAPCADPLAAFAALRRLDPSPYQFFVSAPDHVLFGASPETAVRVAGGTVTVKPIAGTRPRGATPDEDARMEAELRLDPKEAAEHMMLVDLARNDVARVSRPGTRHVGAMMAVERYARVMHLVSEVTGQLRPGLDAFHALQACLNVGTLTGAPKLRAMELLRAAEPGKRGPYGGAVGWIDGRGDADLGVVIRSAVVKGGTATVRAGAGVVHDSDPQREAEETRRKASAILSAIAGAEAAR